MVRCFYCCIHLSILLCLFTNSQLCLYICRYAFSILILTSLWKLQLLLILTKSVNRCFEKNPKFDMAPLLGGTDAVFLSLIHAFSWSVQFFLCLGFILCWINVWKHSLGIPSNGWTGIQRRFFMHTHASLSRNQQGRQLAQFCRMLLIQGFYLHCWCVSTRFVQLHARTCTVILTT